MTGQGQEPRPGSNRIWIGSLVLASALLLSACATTKPNEAAKPAGPNMALETGCVGDKPLAARLAEINTYLTRAFAKAPPFSQAEYDEMRRLGACAGGAVLGVGDGCEAQWAEAKASGLAERSRIRGAQYSIPKYFQLAEAAPVRSQRIKNLLTAQAITWQAHEYNEVRFATGKLDQNTYADTSVALFGVEGMIQQTIACESLR